MRSKETNMISLLSCCVLGGLSKGWDDGGAKRITFSQAAPQAFWSNLVSGHIAKTSRMSGALICWTFSEWNSSKLHQQHIKFVASLRDKINSWAREQQQVQVLESGQQRETLL